MGNETAELYCTSDKEAAKLFGLYLDHKFSLAKVGESGKGTRVEVSHELSTAIYELWCAKDKIYAEAVYFQSVSLHITCINDFIYNYIFLSVVSNQYCMLYKKMFNCLINNQYMFYFCRKNLLQPSLPLMTTF